MDKRWQIPELVRSAEVKVLERRWRGEPVAGKTVLLHSEQGIGDTIQLTRYAPHRHELLLDIGTEAFTVDRPVEDTRCREPVAAQRA